ncbi:hypothetical protein CFAM422_001480 [Trichoderma lentiforme]|uniref:Protein kinase domain-containing protein n=1 Tax=Trichoderma lentiforme TaxID=1567552 RepID=A0A9P4XNX1_9HYPO|nr:hypothetical protein CFAM422_001480 [Trichoderma lentiforme]
MFDLSPFIAYRPLQLINDGRNSTFLVEVTKAGHSELRRNALCVLKIHQASPPDVSYQQERTANSLLAMSYTNPLLTAAASCEVIFARPCRKSIKARYPQCFGSVEVPVELLQAAMEERGWVEPDTGKENLFHALLFEYIPNLEPLMPKDVTPAIVAETHLVLKTIHASNVCHNDLENFRIRPEIGFRNIFIQQYNRNVYILDFDTARIVDYSPEGQRLLEEEANKLDGLFQIILSGEDPRKRFPREVLRLMAERQMQQSG